MSNPENQNAVLEQDEKDTKRFLELNNKTDRTPEEDQELTGLKDRYGKNVRAEIDKLTGRIKDAESRYGQASQRVQELENELNELKNNQVTPPEPVAVNKETVQIGKQAYYTDDALRSMIQAGEITEAKAYQLQRARDKAEIKEEIRQETAQNQEENEFQKTRKADVDKVLGEYPHFDKSHPNFNPEDPLYKTASEIFREGYATNANGLSLAIKRAKQILRMEDKKPDVSKDLSVYTSTSAPGKTVEKVEDIKLTPEEEEAAVRQFTKGDVVNPNTNRPYTKNEAIEKAKTAKFKRIQRQTRRIT